MQDRDDIPWDRSRESQLRIRCPVLPLRLRTFYPDCLLVDVLADGSHATLPDYVGPAPAGRQDRWALSSLSVYVFWSFEQLFRTVRTRGFAIERVSIEAARFAVLCALTLVAGVSCLQLVQDRDGAGKQPLADVFDAADREALEAVSATPVGKTEKQKNTHPRGSLVYAAWVCAPPGGWTGSYGKPGPVVMLRGLYQFRAIRIGCGMAGNV